LAGSTIYQSHRWGEHRSQFGWTIVRLVARIDGRVVAMIQAQSRRYFGILAVFWSPGGPVGDLSVCGEAMRSALLQEVGARFAVFRLNLMRPTAAHDADTLLRGDWLVPHHQLLSGKTLMLDLSADPVMLESLLTRNWRHNLKRSLKRPTNAYHWKNPQAKEMKLAYDSMHAYKGTEHLSQLNSLYSMESLITQFGDSCVIVRCDDEHGNLIALRGALVMGDSAWDTFAAATPEGRKSYASYRAFWTLMELCRTRGVRHYDLGGVDPVNNKGVYDFKQGTGAQVVRFLGEWEHSKPLILGAIVGRRIARRAS
jgi:hypothetical protein